MSSLREVIEEIVVEHERQETTRGLRYGVPAWWVFGLGVMLDRVREAEHEEKAPAYREGLVKLASEVMEAIESFDRKPSVFWEGEQDVEA